MSLNNNNNNIFKISAVFAVLKQFKGCFLMSSVTITSNPTLSGGMACLFIKSL